AADDCPGLRRGRRLAPGRAAERRLPGEGAAARSGDRDAAMVVGRRAPGGRVVHRRLPRAGPRPCARTAGGAGDAACARRAGPTGGRTRARAVLAGPRARSLGRAAPDRARRAVESPRVLRVREDAVAAAGWRRACDPDRALAAAVAAPGD